MIKRVLELLKYNPVSSYFNDSLSIYIYMTPRLFTVMI